MLMTENIRRQTLKAEDRLMYMLDLRLISAFTCFLVLACCKPDRFAERLVTGQSYNRSNQEVNREQDRKEIFGLLQNMFEAVEKKDLSDLNRMIHAEKGVWIDLKARKTAAEFAADLANPDGYVNTYYLNTDALRRKTGETDQLSIGDLIAESDRIRADLFFQEDECEVRLTIERPERLSSQSYRFNNPYFIRQDGRWYLYRLF
jgi:hypothetical protein